MTAERKILCDRTIGNVIAIERGRKLRVVPKERHDNCDCGRMHSDELVIDFFAGGGGASTGIEMAIGRSPDFAINHNKEALAMHEANHPKTKHLRESVFKVDIRAICRGLPVGLAWFSPDCTFFSKAKGGVPFHDRLEARRRRGLAGVVTKTAAQVRPRVILLENVEEFRKWCPLLKDGTPDWSKVGSSFRRWLKRLENLGYVVEWREMRACDYGAPTTRKRLFVVARCDGLPIVWPDVTHGPGLQPYRTAAECIDWSIPVHSIFMTPEEVKAKGLKIKRPLEDATLRRIAVGLKKQVLDAPKPFIVRTAHGDQDKNGKKRGRGQHPLEEPLPTQPCSNDFALVVPTMIQTGWGERKGQTPRALDIHKPVGTLMAEGVKHALVTAFIAKHFGGPSNGGAAGKGVTASAKNADAIVSWMLGLQQRLRRVRVCCGDWKRVTGRSATECIGLTGIFLDPPYGTAAGRDPSLYTHDDLDVAGEVRKWALEHGDNPKLRIALCGYEGEHTMPESWQCIPWKAGGGYAASAGNHENAHRERIWFSPACLPVVERQPSLFKAGA